MAAIVKEGVDYANERLTGDQLKAAGKLFVIRYTSENTKNNPGKQVTQTEINSFIKAGIDIGLIWETSESRATEGFSAGVSDAKDAEAIRVARGLPVMPLFFVAQDAGDITGPQCVQYFKGVASVIGLKRIGGYGGKAVIKYLFDKKLITYGWQTYAWSGVKDTSNPNDPGWDKRAQVQQYHNGATVAGKTVDLCRAMAADYGQYTPTTQEDDMSDAQYEALQASIAAVPERIAHGAAQYDPDTNGVYQHTMSAVVDGLQNDLATVKGQVASLGSQLASLASMLQAMPAAVASAVTSAMAKQPGQAPDPAMVANAVTQLLPQVHLTMDPPTQGAA